MQYLGINYEVKHLPKLDPGFIPFGVWCAAYSKEAKKPIFPFLPLILTLFFAIIDSKSTPRHLILKYARAKHNCEGTKKMNTVTT